MMEQQHRMSQKSPPAFQKGLTSLHCRRICNILHSPLWHWYAFQPCCPWQGRITPWHFLPPLHCVGMCLCMLKKTTTGYRKEGWVAQRAGRILVPPLSSLNVQMPLPQNNDPMIASRRALPTMNIRPGMRSTGLDEREQTLCVLNTSRNIINEEE